MRLHLWRVFFRSSLAPSAPLVLLLHFTLTHQYLIPQCRPQSSAQWRAPQQDPVTPSMTSWSSLRSVSWKPMESKHTCFPSLIPQRQSMHLSLYCFIRFIPMNIYCTQHFLLFSYIPAVVDHRAGMPCHGTFLLHQVRPRAVLHLGFTH